MNGVTEAPPLFPFEEALSNFKSLVKKKRNPPFLFGFLIHITVALEAVMAYRLAADQGAGRTVVAQWISVSALLFVAQLFYLWTTSRVAEFFGKKARLGPLLAFFQTGLIPLLMLLPGVLLLRAASAPLMVYILLGVLLMGRVLGRWREAVQASFRMSWVQSGWAMSASMLTLVGGGISIAYLVLLTKALAFL